MTEPVFSRDPMMASMQAALLKEKEGSAQVEKVIDPVVEAKIEPTIPTPTVTEVVVDLGAKTPIIPIVENTGTPKAPEKVEPQVIQKSFDEQFLEKFENKFKSVDEIKSLLEKPQVKFANEKIAHLNELAEKGFEINKEFLELQSKDYDSWTNAEDIELEAMRILKPEYKGLSEKSLKALLEQKYKISEWNDKNPEDYTPEDEVNIELFERDALNSRAALTQYKNERVLEKQIDPEVSAAMAREAEQNLANWEKFVDTDLVNKITKFSIPVGEKGEQSFEYEISEQDRKEVGEIMKALPVDTNVFFGQFQETDTKGNKVRNHQALAEMMLKARNYEKAISLAYADGVAKEALRAEKEVKNTNFKPAESGSGKPAPVNLQEAMADAVRKQKI